MTVKREKGRSGFTPGTRTRGLLTAGMIIGLGFVAIASLGSQAVSQPRATVEGAAKTTIQLGPTETLDPPTSGVTPVISGEEASKVALALAPAKFDAEQVDFGLFTDTGSYQSIDDTPGPLESDHVPAWAVVFQGGCFPVSHPYGDTQSPDVTCSASDFVVVVIDGTSGGIIQAFNATSADLANPPSTTEAVVSDASAS